MMVVTIGDMTVSSDHESASEGVALAIGRMLVGYVGDPPLEWAPVVIEVNNRHGEVIRYVARGRCHEH